LGVSSIHRSTLGTLIKEQSLLLIGIAAVDLSLKKQNPKNKRERERERIASIDLKANDEQQRQR
jgi:hypothetical protein